MDPQRANAASVDSNFDHKPRRLDYSVQGFVGQLHRDQLPLPIQKLTLLDEVVEELSAEKERFLNCNWMVMGGLKSVLHLNHQVGNIHVVHSILSHDYPHVHVLVRVS